MNGLSILFVYWMIAGLAYWRVHPHKDMLTLFLCMVFGGFLVPAYILVKAIR